MVFSGTTFLFLFLPLLLLLYFPVRNIRWRNGVLLIFSLLFYAWGEPIGVLGMIASTAINHFIARVIAPSAEANPDSFGQRHKKLLLAVAVVASLAMLVWFKYAAFLINSVTALIGLSYRMAEQHLPIGISFYTFQVLTYTLDVYRGKAAPQKSFFRTLLYISCFPQLIAGPIVQYADVAEALNKRTVRSWHFSKGMCRFVLGLGKKILLANLCGQILESLNLAGSGTEMSVLGAWLAAALYAMQLYFDFSAYSDMAIGLGQVFGFKYKENFDHPYIASSVADFWKRWHISLTSFFRDYVYIPLGGNRGGKWKTLRNLFIVWALTGLWHGASWNFLLWGMYWFAFQAFERFVLGRRVDQIPKAVRIPLTLIIALIGWVIFYYTDMSAVGQHLLALFGLAKEGGMHFIHATDETLIAVLRQYTFYPLVAAVFCLPLAGWCEKLFSRSALLKRTGNILTIVLLTAVLALSVIQLVGQSYNPFIYFRF